MVEAPQLVPIAGDIGLTVITGPVGLAIRLGQWLTLDGAPYQHAFLVTDDQGTTVEAMPGRDGVRRNHVEAYDSDRTCYVRVSGMDDADRYEVARQGFALLGAKYSYGQYLSLALLGLGLKPKRLRRRIADAGHVICSQLCDEAYVRARKLRPAVPQLFDDGRQPGDVTPGDLYRNMTAANTHFTWSGLLGNGLPR